MLEFLPELFDMLKNEGYTITEAEAAIFLPGLMEKVFSHDFFLYLFLNLWFGVGQIVHVYLNMF